MKRINKMDISKLLFNETLAELKIGEAADYRNNLEIVTEQEGDIPGIKTLTLNGFAFEITLLDDVILGIQYDFTYEQTDGLFMMVNDEKLPLNHTLVSKDLENFLVSNKINFDLHESNIEPFTIKLKNLNSAFYFDNDHQLFKISVFDMELYRKIINYK